MKNAFIGPATTAVGKGMNLRSKPMLDGVTSGAIEARGLDPELAAKLGICVKRGTISFKYRSQGRELFRKKRAPEKKFWIEPSGQPLAFWNLESIESLPESPDEPLIITEGEFDALALVQAGFSYVISVPNGGVKSRTEGSLPITEDKRFSYLWDIEGNDLIPEVKQFDRIVLFTDGDETGLVLRDELAMRIGKVKCAFVVYPEELGKTKDANEVLQRYGVSTLQRMVSEAKPIRS
jgi:twinkle protein